MRFHELAEYFYNWGWQIKHDHYVAFSDYVKEMLKRKRVMIIQNGDKVTGILFFFLTNDFDLLYKKPTWGIVEDDPLGTQFYVDKMVCQKFSKVLRKEIQEAIENQFPQVVLGVYHRAPKDRCVKIYRRSIHV